MSFLGLPPNIDRLKEKRQVDKLIEALQFRLDESPKGAPVRQAAAAALGDLRDPGAIPALVALAKADVHSDAVREEAVKAILRIGGKGALKGLIALLPDTDHTREGAAFRNIVIKALVHVGAPAVEPLLAAVEAPPDSQQTAAAEALARVGDPRAVAVLVRVCETTTSPDVYHRVSDALYRFQNPAAIPELIITMHETATGNNPHLGIADNVARTALERLTHTSLGDDAREWAAWWDDEGEARFMGGG